ncbi:unnamed protein product [Effrenium voratum]|nr:unnamed protein product [Effrenium voratum]CAJ1461456.1 unnamed protein product [Effrenium voratum]
MQQHYLTDYSEGIEFVRDRLADSLQLLRHSSISSSVYASPTVLGFESDRALSSVSVLSSLGHLSHDPSAYTAGAALHDFELPHQPPAAAHAEADRAVSQGELPPWWETIRVPVSPEKPEARPAS